MPQETPVADDVMQPRHAISALATGVTPSAGGIAIRVFDQLDSTNNEARRLAEAGERGPVWLMTRRQSAGRGRRGRVWQDGEGNLMATLLTNLDLAPLQLSQLAFVAALSVSDIVSVYAPAGAVRLKWPNDLLIEAGKVGGMLIETGAAPDGGVWIALGIGLNLAAYPGDTERPATALAAHLKPGLDRAPSPDEVLVQLAEAFGARLSVWLADGFAPVRAAWLASAEGIGGPCIARLPGETIGGVAEGLDGDGALLLRLPDGALRRITAGDVFFGPQDGPGDLVERP